MAAQTRPADPAPTSTELPAPGDERVLYVVDLSGYLFRAYHALPPLSTSKGEPSHVVHGVAAMLQKLLGERRPALLAVALDSRRRSFRHDLFDGYKANRPETPADLRQQIGRIRELIEAMRIPTLEEEGYEADDLIATLARRARERALRLVIVSADKDLLQLVGDGVVMYDTMFGRVFGVPETEKKMGVPPAKVRDLLALTGDSSDNVPGVPKVGPKTAKVLLERWGDLDGIYAHLDEVDKKAIRATLEEHRESAMVSRELVSLRADVDLGVEPEDLRYEGPDPQALRGLYGELEFTRLLAQLAPAPVEGGDYRTVAGQDELGEVLAAARDTGRLAIFCALSEDDPVGGELVGLAVASGPGKAAYVPIGHRYLGAPPQLPVEEVLAAARPLLEDPDLPKLSADLKRDEVALARHGVELRGGRFDTMLASYLLEAGRQGHGLEEVARAELGVEVTSYDRVTDKQRGSRTPLPQVEVDRARDWAAQRADVVVRVGEVLRRRIDEEEFSALYDELEVPLAHVLAVMERVGIRLDLDRIAEIAKGVDAKLAGLEQRCTELAGRPFNVGSPRQLETILFDELGLRVVKKTKTARSTDHEVLEELAQEHPLPAAIVEHRGLAKLKNTYLDALPRQVDPATGRVHTRYNQAVAVTGRLSSSDPNLQNIPIRTELGRSIRTAFVPEPGWTILAADYSQIELRVLAHLSRDPELCDAFATDADVHTRTATALFGAAPADVTREMRGQAKTVNFAVLYGQTQFALARNLGIERREAKRYIDAFFERYAGVKAYMDRVIEEARETGEVRTILGRRRMMPDLHSKNRQLRQAAERIAGNTPIQGSAADIMKLAMVAIHREMTERALASRMLLTVHDELVFEVPPAEEDTMATLVRERMESARELTVPLVVELGWGPNWNRAH